MASKLSRAKSSFPISSHHKMSEQLIKSSLPKKLNVAMESHGALFASLFVLCFFTCNGANSKLFREYIGAESKTIKLSDVPINPNVEFHFILAFAIDYTNETIPPLPTNGNFNIFLESKHLGPTEIASIKQNHSNVKFAISLAGDTVGPNEYNHVYFAPKSIKSWVLNAVSSLTNITKEYKLDGIDIDYEHFKSDPNTFAECIGQLITKLKKRKVISFASIAPFEEEQVQANYLALWRKYKHVIDYVNFQFYAYDKIKSAREFVNYFEEQGYNYEGGQILASYLNDGSQGLGPKDRFFEACNELKEKGVLGGIFVWCADESQGFDFEFDKKWQEILTYLD